MGKDLDEGVLDGFVGFGGIAQILIRDSRRAPLMSFDQPGKELSRLVHVAPLDQLPDVNRQLRVRRQCGGQRESRPERGARRRIGRFAGRQTHCCTGINTHRSNTGTSETVFTVYLTNSNG